MLLDLIPVRKLFMVTLKEGASRSDAPFFKLDWTGKERRLPHKLYQAVARRDMLGTAEAGSDGTVYLYRWRGGGKGTGTRLIPRLFGAGT